MDILKIQRKARWLGGEGYQGKELANILGSKRFRGKRRSAAVRAKVALRACF